jgi:predicted ribosomally synthesized peptide with nif11-like leader
MQYAGNTRFPHRKEEVIRMGFKEFLQRFNDEKDFEAKFAGLDSIEAVMALASTEGYAISAEEFEALRREMEYREKGYNELSDDEMCDIAGGTSVGIFPQRSSLISSGRLSSWLNGLLSGRKNNTPGRPGAEPVTYGLADTLINNFKAST